MAPVSSGPTITPPSAARRVFSPPVPPGEVRALYCKHFKDRRKERQLISAGSFFVTFASVRGITHAIRAERGPFKNITPGGRHIHHMTFGIAGLLTVTYAPTSNPWARYGGLLMVGFGLGPTVPNCMTWTNEIFQRRHGHRHSTDDLLTGWYAAEQVPAPRRKARPKRAASMGRRRPTRH